MKKIETKRAVGHVLCHDITQIIKDKTKGVAFKKGHIVREEDIPVLLSIGKDYLYIWEKEEGMLHENEGACFLREMCKNDYMTESEIKEGKIDLFADYNGLFKINREALYAVNELGELMISTRHGNTAVKRGDKLAGMRVIPLVIAEEKLKLAQKLAGDQPILKILPFQKKKVGIVTTGNEVYYGRIQDTFGPVIKEKVSELDLPVIGQKIVNDDPEKITSAILSFIEEGANVVLCTGGMSVDPDDCTPLAIKNTGAQMITYGAPVLPGAMMVLAYYEAEGKRIPIIGLPGCVMYAKRTIFDLILPRILADDVITKSELARLSEGGLCLNCDICMYPNCGFGKGG